MNLKYFRKHLKESSDRLDMTYSMMHILIYAYHSEFFTKQDIINDIPLGADTIQHGVKLMKDKRLINTLRGGGNGTPALYNLSGVINCLINSNTFGGYSCPLYAIVSNPIGLFFR